MKNKLIVILMAVVAVLCLCFCITGCAAIGKSDGGHKHVYNKEINESKYLVHDATCTESAVYYYSCSCGQAGTKTFTSGKQLGHLFTDYISDHNAKCLEDGTKTAHCDRVGCDATDSVAEEGTALGHSFTSYISDNNATYTNDGTKTAHCDREDCNATNTIPDEGSMLEKEPDPEYKSVTFKLNGGTGAIEPMDFAVGKVMAKLPTPTRNGYRFVCWADTSGKQYKQDSVMPDSNLVLLAVWEKLVSEYSDSYVSLKPAKEGYKSGSIYDKNTRYVDKFVYVEITSSDLEGAVGNANNFTLQTLTGMEYSLEEGYTWLWYKDDFETLNGAQVFTLHYGSNIQFFTVSNSAGIVQCRYLLDIYVLYDYTISLYSGIYENYPYKTVRVVENDCFPESTTVDDIGFEFDKRVYYNDTTNQYEEFEYSTIITHDWHLYQTYKPATFEADTDGGALEGALTIKPYSTGFVLPTPQKDGYDFLGWKLENGKFITNENGESGVKYISKNNACKKLTAAYDIKRYYAEIATSATEIVFTSVATTPRIEYSDDNNTKISKIYYIPEGSTTSYSTDSDKLKMVGDEVTITTPTVDGKTWVGWFDGDTLLTNEKSYTFEFNCGKIYEARWIDCPVALEKNIAEAGIVGGIPETTYVGQEVTATASTNTGYTWLGWYDGDTLLTNEVIYTFNIPEENITYTAKWTYYIVTVQAVEGGSLTAKTGVTVSFDLNGASGLAPESQRITDSNGLEYPTIPTRTGYVFAGWYDNSLCTGSPFDFSATVTGNKTLYAKWISYSGTDAILPNTNISATVTSRNDSNKKYYAFVPLVSGSVTFYTTGSLDTYGYLYSSTMAQLKTDDDSGDGNNFKITYTLTAGTLYYISPCGYNSSGTATLYYTGRLPFAGGRAQVMDDLSVGIKTTAGENVILSVETNPGYAWVGLFNGEIELTNELSYNFNMPSENVTYTAKWSKVNLEINNNEAGYISSLTGKYKVGDEVTITATTNNGYTWVGWYNGETELTKELDYTFNMPSENVTYVAKWSANHYLITLDANGGELDGSSQVEVIMGGTVNLDIPSKNGYIFGGWLTQNNDKVTNEVGEMIGAWAYPQDSTLVAQWLRTLTFNSNGGASVNTKYVEPGAKVTLPSTSNNGYSFKGWQYNSTTYKGEFTMPDADVTLSAQWEANKYYIYYNGTSLEVTYGEYYNIPTPTRTGYTFKYYTLSGSTSRFSQSGTYRTVGSTYLTCKWLADLSKTVSAGCTITESTQNLESGMTFTLTYSGTAMKNFSIETNTAVTVTFTGPGWTYRNTTKCGINSEGGSTKMVMTITIINPSDVSSFQLKFTCKKTIVTGQG